MSSRRSRRTHNTQPKYSSEDFELDFDSYSNANSVSSKRSTRTKPDDIEPEVDAEKEAEAELETEQEPGEDLEELEEVTRCICGSDDLFIPKNNNGEFDDVDPGFFIQCETCAVWQHGYCVGIYDTNTAPEKYWCEKCRPDHHTIFTDVYGIRRSKYDPSKANQNTNHSTQKKGTKRKNGRFISAKSEEPVDSKPSLVPQTEESEMTDTVTHKSNELADQNDGTTNETNDEYYEEEDDDGHKRKHRKRPSYSYRDYNYEEMLKKALEESAKESGVVPEEVNISSSEGPGRAVRETRHATSRKTRAKSHDESLPDNEEPTNSELHGLSLQTNETKIADDDKTDTTTVTKNEKNEDMPYKKPKVEDRRRVRDSKRIRSRRNTSAPSASNDEHEEEIYDKMDNITPTSKSSSSTSKSANSVISNPTTPKRTNKREKKESKNVSEDKPFRANIPSARINMNEMTRRIFSIMDFVSNIQINLSNEEEFKNNLFKMDNAELNSEIIELKNKLIGCYNESVEQLDNLTALLNTWQSEHV